MLFIMFGKAENFIGLTSVHEFDKDVHLSKFFFLYCNWASIHQGE